MKNSKIILEKGKNKEECKVLLKVEAFDKEYILYTKDEEDECGEKIAYAAMYDIKSNKIKPVEDEMILEFLDSILLHLQNKINPKEESEKSE